MPPKMFRGSRGSGAEQKAPPFNRMRRCLHGNSVGADLKGPLVRGYNLRSYCYCTNRGGINAPYAGPTPPAADS